MGGHLSEVGSVVVMSAVDEHTPPTRKKERAVSRVEAAALLFACEFAVACDSGESGDEFSHAQ